MEVERFEESAWSVALWRGISLLIWSISGMYGLALADAFLYDNLGLQEQFEHSWSGAPPFVMTIVTTLHIKWMMFLSLCFGTIVNLGMALSNLQDKPIITAQIASFDNLIQPLYSMKDPYTALVGDSDRLLAVGIARIFYEWLPRSWLQESLIMAHCSNVWELPFCLFSILFALVGICTQAFFSYKLSQQKIEDNSADLKELNCLRKALLRVMAFLSVIGAILLVVRLIAAEYCKGPWGLTTGCLTPCISEVDKLKH